MIYAKEAYLFANENKQTNSAKELFDIEKKIKKAICQGKYFIEINRNTIAKETCNELKKFGYQIKKSYCEGFYLNKTKQKIRYVFSIADECDLQENILI